MWLGGVCKTCYLGPNFMSALQFLILLHIYSKPSNNSFMYAHQKEKHNSSPLDCKLNTKRYYGKDRLACQVAEAVPLKMRTGENLNTKGGEFYNPPLVSIRQEIQRGLRNMT